MKTKVDENLEKAERLEVEMFFRMSKVLYNASARQFGELFDIAYEKTRAFTTIDPGVILEDSRIISILRYCMVPPVSQMKLGQSVGVGTTSEFEKEIVGSGRKLALLRGIAPKIARIFADNLDLDRFIWIKRSVLTPPERHMAIDYARKWTCSLIASQDSVTRFRNWRKEKQESTAAKFIIDAGYQPVRTRRIVSSVEDLLPGQFSRECRIRGRNVQKADFAIRLANSGKLLLVEAKAIGVKIDAFKRIKECREKFDDWKARFGGKVCCAVILSGFIPRSEYDSLVKAGGIVFWEHAPAEISAFLRTR